MLDKFKVNSKILLLKERVIKLNIENRYNEVPYISKSFPNTHPNMMAVITGLYDFEAPNLNNARVLEIGCSFGGNIIPLAITYPEAQFIGLDLSDVQIKEGQKLIKRFGLDNITLEHMNIMDYNDNFGKFDYVICHGVFSWVPKEVQIKILQVIKSVLTENGLASISYNTNPGWKDLSIARDIMRWNQKNLKVTGQDIVKHGKKNLEILKEYSALENGTKKKLSHILSKSSYYLYHEYYEEFNEAFYLYEFQELLQQYGLSHISDTDLEKTLPIHWDKSDEVEDILSFFSPIEKEQYYDFLYNRQFRVSIVTHAATKINIERTVDKNNLEKIYYRASTFSENGKYIFESYKEILKVLESEYPKFISGKELLNRPEIVDDKDRHAKLLDLLYRKHVAISTHNLTSIEKEIIKLSEKWRKYITYFIEEKNPIISLSSASGEILNIDSFIAEIILQFDGRDENELLNHLLEAEKKGEIVVKKELEEEKIVELKKLIKDVKQTILASYYAE